MFFGFLALCRDLSAKQFRQVTELLAGAVDHGLHIHQQQLGQLVATALFGQGEGLGNTGAIGCEGVFELVVQRLAFSRGDQLVVGGDFVAQLLVPGIHLAAVLRDVLRVRVQRHAQGNGANAQHDFAYFITAANARQPLFLHRHFTLANARHLPQRKNPEQRHEHRDQGKTQCGTGGNIQLTQKHNECLCFYWLEWRRCRAPVARYRQVVR
ncbi:hypothetical protein D3C85_1008540 [compost metagenome]